MFILQNQDGYFLSKTGEWLDGRASNLLFRTPNKDEAVNQLFEVNSQDYNLRINILECETTSKNLPLIPEDLLPPPIVDETAEEKSDKLATESDDLHLLHEQQELHQESPEPAQTQTA